MGGLAHEAAGGAAWPEQPPLRYETVPEPSTGQRSWAGPNPEALPVKGEHPNRCSCFAGPGFLCVYATPECKKSYL